MNCLFPPYLQRNTVLKQTEQFITKTCKHRPESHGTQHMIQVAMNARIIASLISSLYCIGLYIGICIVMIIFLTIFSQYMYVHPIISTLLVIGIYINRIIYFDPDALIFIVQMVALLHDVDDHKYHADDPHISTKLSEFLDHTTQIYNMVLRGSVYEYLYNTKMILRIIKLISFSRQEKFNHTTEQWNKYLGVYGTFIRNIVSDADKLEALGIRGFNRCVEYTKELFYKNHSNYTQTNIVIGVKQHYKEKLHNLATLKYMKTIPGYLYSLYLKRVLINLICKMQCDINISRPFISSNKDMKNLIMNYCTKCVRGSLKRRFPDTYQMIENLEKTGYLCTNCVCNKKHLNRLNKLINTPVNPASIKPEYFNQPNLKYECIGCKPNAHSTGSVEWNYVIKSKTMFNDMIKLCDNCESFYHENIIIQPENTWKWNVMIDNVDNNVDNNIQLNRSLITLKDRILGFTKKYLVNFTDKTINMCLDCKKWNPSYSIKAYGALKDIKSHGLTCIRCIWLHKQKENIELKKRGIRKINTISYCTKCCDHLNYKDYVILTKLKHIGFGCIRCAMIS